MNLSFGFPSGNNGNISTQTNGVYNGRTQTYTYDNLNRLLTAQAQATSGVDCWGQSFGNGTNAADDPLANLLTINRTQCSPPGLSVGVNSHNQLNSPVQKCV